MIRAFVGLPLPESYQAAPGELKARWGSRFSSKLTWTRKGDWHLTLKFLGPVMEDQLEELRAALSRVRFFAFDFRAAGGGFFPSRGRPRVFWLGLAQGAEACQDLAAKVEAAVSPLGFAPEKRPFSPHLTLARVRAPGLSEDPWPKVLADLEARDFPLLTQDRFVLWRSAPSPSGSVYTPLGEFPAAAGNGVRT